MLSVHFGHVYKLTQPSDKDRVVTALKEKSIAHVVRQTSVEQPAKPIPVPGFWTCWMEAGLWKALGDLLFPDPVTYTEPSRDESLSGTFVILGDSLKPYYNARWDMQTGERTYYYRGESAFYELLRAAQSIEADTLLQQVQ